MNRDKVLQYFRSIAQKENNENNKISLKDLISETKNKRALFLCSGDLNIIFAATSFLESFHKKYKKCDLYFACHEQFHSLLNGNPYIKKCLPIIPAMENELTMIGGEDKIFDYYLNTNHSILKKHYL